MGRITTPLPVKLFVGVLTSLPEILPEVESQLTSLFGAIDERSDLIAFDCTTYYDDQMGHPIRRCFFGLVDLIPATEIAAIKIQTNDLEAKFQARHTQLPRPVNLDPGYMEQSKVVLASTKNFYHRLLIAEGIYAEVTLHFEAGAWRPFPWTFPDFRDGRYDAFFTALRRRYREQLGYSR